MKKILLLLTLALCACTSIEQTELGVTYDDIVIKYGAPNNETYANGMRVCTWWEPAGVRLDKYTRVFDANGKCISIKRQ